MNSAFLWIVGALIAFTLLLTLIEGTRRGMPKDDHPIWLFIIPGLMIVLSCILLLF